MNSTEDLEDALDIQTTRIVDAIDCCAMAIETLATAIAARGGDTSIPAIDPDKET